MSPLPPPDPALVALWPPAGLRVTCDDVELRYLDDAALTALAHVAADGVHDPDYMPFTVPWTSGTAQEVARSVLVYQWQARASLLTDDWKLELAVVRGGELVGAQGALTKRFRVRRTVETGSWLGRRFQGQGVGTRMRLMMLHLLFEGLGVDAATTSAFADNARSLGVTRRLGYAENGYDVNDRLGTPARTLKFVMDRATWDARPAELRLPVRLEGVDAVRAMLDRDAAPGD